MSEVRQTYAYFKTLGELATRPNWQIGETTRDGTTLRLASSKLLPRQELVIEIASDGSTSIRVLGIQAPDTDDEMVSISRGLLAMNPPAPPRDIQAKIQAFQLPRVGTGKTGSIVVPMAGEEALQNAS
jgi:hypothetical protein